MSTALGVQGCWSEQAQALLAGAAGTQHGGTCDRLCTAGPAKPAVLSLQRLNILPQTLNSACLSTRMPSAFPAQGLPHGFFFVSISPAGLFWGPRLGHVSAKLLRLLKKAGAATLQTSILCIEQECQRFLRDCALCNV